MLQRKMNLQIFVFIFLFAGTFKAFSEKISSAPHPSSMQQQDIDPHFATQISPEQKLKLENKKVQALTSFITALNFIETQYVDPESIQVDMLVEKAIAAIASDLDPHTLYLTPEQFKKFTQIESKELAEKKFIKTYDLSHNTVYLKLPVFHDSSFEETQSQLKKFQIKHDGKINGLIFDLRNNPGGLFDQAVKIANLFIDSGIIVSTVGQDKKKPQHVEYAIRTQTFDNFPIIVLVDSGTASAGEILVGALQDHKRALIMGSTTYGKGSVQKILRLPNGGALKITTARYYTPSGQGIQAEGIIPDVIFSPKGESYLKKHLDNKELNVSLPKNEFYHELDSWHSDIRGDELIKKAYFYLRK